MLAHRGSATMGRCSSAIVPATRFMRSSTETVNARRLSSGTKLGQRCLRLGQPEGHVHCTVEADGGG